ncbi:hypothetical protein SNEBB_007657 [Seison nebaliae]|nr:hypothetical protein SNEBB_007657 [Seison nebaliae]
MVLEAPGPFFMITIQTHKTEPYKSFELNGKILINFDVDTDSIIERRRLCKNEGMEMLSIPSLDVLNFLNSSHVAQDREDLALDFQYINTTNSIIPNSYQWPFNDGCPLLSEESSNSITNETSLALSYSSLNAPKIIYTRNTLLKTACAKFYRKTTIQ